MSEHVVEAELGGGRALSSFTKMTGQGEGIYASSTSAGVGLQQTDQVGLTLSPKTKSGDKLSLDACMITDQDFEEALKQLEPLLADHEERTPSFRVDPTYDVRRHYVAAPNKRRKLSGDLYEPLFQRLSSSPITWPRSVSFPIRTQQEATEHFLQPTLNTVSPEPVKVCAGNQHHDDINETQCLKPLELPLSPPDESPEGIRACQEDRRNAHLSTHENIESVEETSAESIALKSSRHAPTNGRGIGTAGSDCAVSGKDLKGQGSGIQNGHDSEMLSYGIGDEESAGGTNLHQGKVLWDPDIPLHSIEENQGLGVDSHTDMRSSRTRSFNKAAAYGVSICFPLAPSQTIAGVAKVAANETTRKFEPSQDSLQSSRKLLQTSTPASIAKLILQSSQQALVEGYSRSLSSHQIPAELRKRFHALLRKFQSDEQFQKAVATYAMELTGKLQSSGIISSSTNRVVGAVPPGNGDSYSLPLKLRQVFDALIKKTNTDESFKMSVDTFVMEYLSKLQSSDFLSTITKDALGDRKINEDLLSEVMELDGNQLYDKFRRKDLSRLSTDQLTKYCRELEVSRAYFAKELRAARDAKKKWEIRDKDKHRPLHHPKDLNPNPGTWTCFHPQTTRKDNKDEPCGKTNPHYERRVIWNKITDCKACKGPYDEDFKSRKLKTPRKKYYKPKANPGHATTPDARQSPANAHANTQFNDPANPQTNDSTNAQANDFHASSITQQDPLIGASSGQMYGYLAEDDQDDTRHLSPGWHSDNDGLQYTPVSDRFHSTPMDDPFSSTNGKTENYHPMDSPGFQNPDIGYTNALNLNMDFTGQDGEFDEFAIDSDPLFMDLDIDPNLQQAGSFLEQTNIFQENLPQALQNSARLSGLYPAQVNLFPQDIGSHSQSQTSSSSAQPRSTFADLSSQEAKSGNVGKLIYSAGFVPASLEPQHKDNRGLAATRLGQLNSPYQSPYGPISPFSLPQSANSGTAGPTGTLLSFPQSGGTVPLRSTPTTWPSQGQSGAELILASPHISLQTPIMRQALPPATGDSLSLPQPSQMMTHTRPAIVVTDADSEDLAPVSYRRGRRPSPIPKLPRAKTGRGLAGRAATNADSPTSKKRAPSQKPRLSRAKAAVAERAALRDSVTKTPEPERPLTETQINRVHARNNTSAIFLGGPRKSWQQPVESYPPKVIIEIPDDEAAAQEASEVPQGAVADQDASDALDEAFLAQFNAEFDRQDRAAALEVLEEEGEEDEEDKNDDEMGGDDESRHSDRVIAVAAAAAAADESEE